MKINIKRILVTGANGDIANAIGRVISSIYPESILIGTDLGNIWPGRIVYSEMHTLPRADEPEYINSLIRLVNECNITCVIPCTEPELNRLVSEWDKVCELPLLMNLPEVIETGLDKIKTMNWLNSIEIDTPLTTTLEAAEAKNLPLFTKPRTGSGSRNLQVINTQEHLALYKSENADLNLIAQNLLEPHQGEFTCAIFKHKMDVRTLTMRRWLSGGLTSRMIVENIPSINKILLSIADGLPTTAVINVQLRMTNDGPKVFEINPRLSSTVMMRHKIGFSDLEWWFLAINNEKIPEFETPIGIQVYRTYSEEVIDAG